MTKLLLSLHVLAAILAVGPVTVAASMFPGVLRRLRGNPGGEDAAILRVLHRICRVYAAIGIALLLFGFGTAISLGVLSSPWLITSIILTFAAAAVLILLILPAQEDALSSALEPGADSPLPSIGRLAMTTGVFNLLWATVTILMIIRPGSTTGA
ncbi:DUF2269 family protein [Streptomyces sp. TS71-3]|uniref:DUF2269 family protein n=1 Tax=Streptomyces sp. TS71-3 TaxID=2733862 RepID=UPI001B18FB81|nr:DUF2269 family protein [Streptomyces sp. TS71-3]GHJ37471.1 hypothetical conserved integral membrane protein [Streptomyces sp. TS71-3]